MVWKTNTIREIFVYFLTFDLTYCKETTPPTGISIKLVHYQFTRTVLNIHLTVKTHIKSNTSTRKCVDSVREYQQAKIRN